MQIVEAQFGAGGPDIVQAAAEGLRDTLELFARLDETRGAVFLDEGGYGDGYVEFMRVGVGGLGEAEVLDGARAVLEVLLEKGVSDSVNERAWGLIRSS